MSATVSLGLSLLWDTDLGLSHVDKYTYSSEEYIKAGVLLATGILNSGVRTEADLAKGLIGKYVNNKSVPLKPSAIMGLGLAYADSHREDLLQLLIPHISDGMTIEIASGQVSRLCWRLRYAIILRLYQVLDVAGQAGKPRTISGLQTHQMPVRLATTERAELATEEFI
jgi:hypothetical protein